MVLNPTRPAAARGRVRLSAPPRHAPEVGAPADPADGDLAALEQVQRRVLWLSTRMVHEANHVRPNPDGTKVGGHQASSASLVSILTALCVGWLRAGDRVAVKPHASPAYHAIQYLLGRLDRRYLTTLRQFGGLQAYPSRTKDPDPVDFSTGSVGLGVAATLFAALADRYAEQHFGAGSRDERRAPADPGQRPGGERAGPALAPPSEASARRRRRFVGLVGDAELDEGNVWEAVMDASVQGARLGNVLWIVDLNRQSLDRVVPGIRAGQLEALFAAAGWQVLEAKYGRTLQAAFARPGGVALRRRVDEMSNEEYQALVRLPGAQARERLLAGAPPAVQPALRTSVADVSDEALPGVLGDLGGHDLAELRAAFEAADRDTERPTVLFAYTMKGWGLPIAGDPLNHAALLTQAQLDGLRRPLGVDPADDWAAFAPDSPPGRLCRRAAERLREVPPAGEQPAAIGVPPTLSTRVGATASSQDAFGSALVELARAGGELARRVVTSSPDVSISTSLGGWINRVGVFAVDEAPAVEGEGPRLLRWQPGPRGQHLELGISEMNLFLLLGQLGLSRELNGELLLPVGTVYDPFVCRGLDALIYGTYSGSKFVFAGTPAGVSLSPEGGAHQSAITVSLGLELPGLQLYEPCFARETEWCLLEGLRQCLDREHGLSTYLRLSTRPIVQAPFEAALARLGEHALRQQALAGGYRLLEADPELSADAPRVVIAASGPILPEALDAAGELHAEGVAASVLNVTSADRLYRAWHSAQLGAVRSGRIGHQLGRFDELLMPEERTAPVVTVLDGASHALAFLGSVYGQRVVPLGVDGFGQSGRRADLHGAVGIDAAHIANAALLALAGMPRSRGA